MKRYFKVKGKVRALDRALTRSESLARLDQLVSYTEKDIAQKPENKKAFLLGFSNGCEDIINQSEEVNKPDLRLRCHAHYQRLAKDSASVKDSNLDTILRIVHQSNSAASPREHGGTVEFRVYPNDISWVMSSIKRAIPGIKIVRHRDGIEIDKSFIDSAPVRDSNITMLGVKLEFVEGQHFNKPQGLVSLDKMNEWLLAEDAKVRASKEPGYDKAYIDVIYQVDGKKYRIHGMRADLGDGPNEVKITNNDLEWARKALDKFLQTGDKGYGTVREGDRNSVKDAYPARFGLNGEKKGYRDVYSKEEAENLIRKEGFTYDRVKTLSALNEFYYLYKDRKIAVYRQDENDLCFYNVPISDSEPFVNYSELNDDRLSPMTYKKLKELGYSHEDWKDLSQEQANKIVQENSNKSETSSTSKKEESTRSSSQQAPEKKELTEEQKYAQLTADKIYKAVETGEIYSDVDGNSFVVVSKSRSGYKLSNYPDGGRQFSLSLDDFTEKMSMDRTADEIAEEFGIEFAEPVPEETSSESSSQVPANQVPASIELAEDKKYGSNPKLDELVDSKSYYDRLAAVKQGYGLDKLVNNDYEWIREAVAKQGYGLDKLVDDEDNDVRVAVAEQGYGLDKLIDDESREVRKAVRKYIRLHPEAATTPKLKKLL